MPHRSTWISCILSFRKFGQHVPRVNLFRSFDLAYSPLARRTCMASRDRGAETCPSRGAPRHERKTHKTTSNASDSGIWGTFEVPQHGTSFEKRKTEASNGCDLQTRHLKTFKTEDLQNKKWQWPGGADSKSSSKSSICPHVLFPHELFGPQT